MDNYVIFHLSQEPYKDLEKAIRAVDMMKNQSIEYRLIKDAKELLQKLQSVDFCANRISVLVDSSFINIKSGKPICDGNRKICKYLILAYPEVNFFFIGVEGEKPSWNDNLLPNSSMDFISEFHEIHSGSSGKAVLKKLLYYDNLFDYSLLRYHVREEKFIGLMIRNNFSKLSEFRSLHQAMCIDEESSVALHNAYCMYSCGYSSFPISTHYVFGTISSLIPPKGVRILRDFDLQFADAPEDFQIELRLVKGDEIHHGHRIDLIRGYKRTEDDKSHKWMDLTGFNASEEADSNDPYGKIVYWPQSLLREIYCVSQGYDNLEIVSGSQKWEICDRGLTLKAPGVKKPTNGVFVSFYESNVVKDILDKTRPSESEEDYHISRSRFNHDHSCPLDLYNIARPLIERATLYWENKLYYLAALLSNEAIEILNGFHVGLTLEAYLLHAKSENAIAMNMLGCNEEKLAKDCEIRVGIIKYDIYRLVKNSTQSPKNVLNQIFSDCRQYCHEKEHFQSEEVFIDAMAKLNDGGPCPLFKKLKSIFKD